MGEPVTPAYPVKNMQLRNAQLSDNQLRSLRVLSVVLLQRIASSKHTAPAQTEEDVHHIVRWSAAYFRPSKGRMFLKFPAYSECITNVNKSIVICCFGNTEISNSLGGELTRSNDELNNIINTYRRRFVYLCVYAIGAILWRPFE